MAPGGDAGVETACDPFVPRAMPPEVIIGPDEVEPQVLGLIDGATATVDVMMYSLTIDSFVDALIAAHARGVEVRVMVDPDQPNGDSKQRLATAGIEARDAPAMYDFAHSKFLIVDGDRAIVASFNLSFFSIDRERNYGVIDRDPEDIVDLQRIFDADWNGGSPPPNLVCTRLVVSPANSRSRLLALINSADDTLDLALMYLSDDQLALAVRQRAAAGVAVRALLAEPGWITGNEVTAQELTAAGIPVRYAMDTQMHAKLIVADGVAFVGSENMSFTSLDQNREVGLFLTEPAPAAEIATQFEADWAAGVPAP
jgi:phosphatidylserine/phosphatidylglycerophosphate/cardiolipin synthase-like enzyme